MGFYSRHVRERVIYPHEERQANECLAFLLDLVKRRRFEMILPLGDVVTQLVCSRREEFQIRTPDRKTQQSFSQILIVESPSYDR